MKYISDNELELDLKDVKYFLRNKGYSNAVLKETNRYPLYIQMYITTKGINRNIVLCEKKLEEKIILCYLEPIIGVK
jgi:hypothetical protein